MCQPNSVHSNKEQTDRTTHVLASKTIEQIISTFLPDIQDKLLLSFLRGLKNVFKAHPDKSVSIVFDAKRDLEKYIDGFAHQYPHFNFDKHEKTFQTFCRAFVHYQMSEHSIANNHERLEYAQKIKDILEDAGSIDSTGVIAEGTSWEVSFLKVIVDRTKEKINTNTIAYNEICFTNDLTGIQLDKIADYLFARKILIETQPFKAYISGKNEMIKVPAGKILYYMHVMKILYKEKKVIRLTKRNNTCLSHITTHIVDFNKSLKKSKPSQYLKNQSKQNPPDAQQLRDLTMALNQILK